MSNLHSLFAKLRSDRTTLSRLGMCLAVVLAPVTSTCGCRSRVSAVDTANREHILLLGNGSEPKDLDPHTVTGVTEFNIITALLEGLVSEDPTDLRPVPGVAERWNISPDGKLYTFHLREDAKWSNGDPVTSADFVFSYKRILSPALGSAYAYMLFCLENARSFNHGEITDFTEVGVKAPNDRTLTLTLTSPVPYFLSLLNHHSWYPVHPATVLKFGRIDAIGSKWTRPANYVSNGPFALESWEPGKKIEVRKSSTYWDRASVRLNGIRFYPIGDHKIEERAFQAGQLHVTGTVPIDRIPYYSAKPNPLLRLDPYLGVYYYLLNVARPPLDDVRVRRALAMAIDRDQIVRYVTKAGESPAYHFTPPDTAGYTARARLPTDFGRARELMTEAGYPGGKGFPRLQLLYNTSDAHARIAQAIQQMWKDHLGIDIELLNMEWKVYLAKTQEKRYDIARAGWIGDYVDPNTFLDMWVTGGGNNRTGWSEPEYDRLISAAATESDMAARFQLFQQAEQLLLLNAPLIPIYFYRSKSLVQPSVRGWNPTILDHHPYKHVWLEVD